MGFQGTKINPSKFHKSQLKFYLILVPLAIFMILPVVYIINQAFKPLDELFMFPPRFFVQKPTLHNFRDLFRTASETGVPMSRYLFNSVVVTFITVVLTIYITVSTGYALSKKKFRGRKKLFAINQMALMFVAIAVMIPRYLIVVNVGIQNSIWAHIIPYLAAPVSLFLLKQFIDQIPDQLLEAARIDGANDFQIVTKIVIPLIKPAIATVALLTFQFAWNQVESSNFYITDETIKTFAFYLNTLTLRTAENSIIGAGKSAAASLVVFIPNLVIFILMQSKVMNTMSHSGIK